MSLAVSSPSRQSPAPSRSPAPAASALISLRRVRSDLTEVSRGERVVGYIEEAGGVFVALQGSRYDIAVEAGQSLVIERAVSLVAAEQGS